MMQENQAAVFDFTPKIWRIVIGIGLFLLLAALDQTIVATALPTMVAELGGVDQLSWVVTAYILTSTVSAPIYGKLGDLYGRRNTIFISVGLFMLGSILCGLSQTMGQLIASRSLQGLGGGGIFVLALSIIGEIIPPNARGKIQGLFAAVFGLSSAIGPLLGGYLVDVASWHWIFFVNIPVGILAFYMFVRNYTPSGTRDRRNIDWGGAATLTTALTSLTLATALGGTSFPWGSWQILTLLIISIGSIISFIAIERRTAEPILPPSLFRNDIFLICVTLSTLVGMCMIGILTFMPVYLQLAQRASPTMSGLMLIPFTIGTTIGSLSAGSYMRRTSRYKAAPLIGNALLVIAMAMLLMLQEDTPYWYFALSITAMGTGLGANFPVLTSAVQNVVPYSQLGAATAAGVMFRQIGGSLGVAAFGAIFAQRMIRGLTAGPDVGAPIEFDAGLDRSLSPEAVASLPPEAQKLLATVVSDAINPLFIIGTGLALLTLVLSFWLRETRLSNQPAQKR